MPLDPHRPRADPCLSVGINLNLCSLTLPHQSPSFLRTALRLGHNWWSVHSLPLCKPVVSYLSCQRVLLNSDICLQISDSWYYLLICTTVSFQFVIGRLLAKSLSHNTIFVLQHLCIMHCAGLRCVQMGCREHIIWDSFTGGALQWRLLLEYILNVRNCSLVLNF